jgi:hypothetical protein
MGLGGEQGSQWQWRSTTLGKQIMGWSVRSSTRGARSARVLDWIMGPMVTSCDVGAVKPGTMMKKMAGGPSCRHKCLDNIVGCGGDWCTGCV